MNQLDNITTATEAQDPGKPDPTCRFSTFCHSVSACGVCHLHSRLIDDRELSGQQAPTTIEAQFGVELPDPRDAYLAAIGVTDLRNRAHALLPEIAELRLSVNRLKDRLASFQDAEELVKARLMMSDAYNDKAGPGRNAETREAWLRQQRRDDLEYAAAISAREQVGRELSTVEALLEAKGRMLNVTLSEMRLVSSQLAFLSGER